MRERVVHTALYFYQPTGWVGFTLEGSRYSLTLNAKVARKLMLMTSPTGEVLCMWCSICYVILYWLCFFRNLSISHPNTPITPASKGPVLHTAVIAGIQGAKKTSDLLPFCHPMKLDHCKVWHVDRVDCHLALSSRSFIIGRHRLNIASSGSCRTCGH